MSLPRVLACKEVCNLVLKTPGVSGLLCAIRWAKAPERVLACGLVSRAYPGADYGKYFSRTHLASMVGMCLLANGSRMRGHHSPGFGETFHLRWLCVHDGGRFCRASTTL